MTNDDFGYEYSIGVDPGAKNLGLAIVKSKGVGEAIHLVHSETINPSELGSAIKTATYISRVCEQAITFSDVNDIYATIERYVPYNNVFTSESESITMLIGVIAYSLDWEFLADEPRLVRAIDWKMSLVKALFKTKGFNNPSDKLDKKFSIAAAKACLFEGENMEIQTDHEADATCLASLRFIPDC